MISAFVLVLCVTQTFADVTVSVDTNAPISGAPISPSFVGFSIEVMGALGMMGEDGDRVAFANLLEELYKKSSGAHAGPNLRIGGNSADESCFRKTLRQKMPDGCSFFINETQLLAYKRFASSTAHAANVSFVIDTNFGLSPDPSVVAVGHVAALDTAGLWPYTRGVEIGNEMDIYADHANVPGKPHHRNASYTYNDYFVEYAPFVRQYRDAGMPGRRLQGGTFAGSSWNKYIPDLILAYGAEMATYSMHKYARTTCNDRTVTQVCLLAYAAAGGQMGPVAEVINNNSGFKEFYIGEGNSASCGGQEGVSDTFTATLWSLDFLSALSKTGVRGMNFHGGPAGPYSAIAFSANGTVDVRPLYYGLLAFTELTCNHSHWVSATVSNSAPAGSDPTCATGTMTSSHSDDICCSASCGVCGGTGCNDRPGGSDSCCAGSILSANVSCAEHGPPCVVRCQWCSLYLDDHCSCTLLCSGSVTYCVFCWHSTPPQEQHANECPPRRRRPH
eukprot:m.1062510 g.1062510  ORF g.1062510 m.1062510 type:complete len:503 (-) comp24215_c0_seq18:1654-3162(-)